MVLQRLLKQSAIPLVLSIAYASWVYSGNTDSKSLTGWITPFAGSFFFCMWLMGQFLRTSKQPSDAEQFSQLSVGLAEINQSIGELKSASQRNLSVPEPRQSSQLFAQAKEIAGRGDVFAGLLQAGVAFEQAIHDKAKRQGLNRKEFRSLPHLIREIESMLGPGAKREIEVLWRLRNQIVHADEAAVQELQNQPGLIHSFERGIEMLSAERDAF